MNFAWPDPPEPVATPDDLPLLLELAAQVELRGDVRRGYFVQGVAGAQFAMPGAVEQLRAAAAANVDDLIVVAASDPANVWNLPRATTATEPLDSFARPRGARSLLVMQRGRVIATSDARARTIGIRVGLEPAFVTTAVRAIIEHVTARRSRDIVIETINGAPSTTSPLSELFVAAGLRLTTAGLRYYASL